LTGETVTFSSGNLLVGTIGNLTGIVTALAAGSTTITATDGSLHATATLNVSATQPPPTGNWPNAPSSYPLLSDQPFDGMNTLGWGMVFNSGASVVQDATAPASPSNVLQFMYPAGMAGGTAPGTEYFELNGATHFYSGIWWKPSNPWQGHDSNINKIQFLFMGNSQGDMALEMYGSPGGPYHIQICMQFLSGDTRCWLTPNVNNVAVTLGKWHQIEWLVDEPSSTIKWWLDGQLIGSYSDVVFPSGGLAEYKISPTWGGVGDLKAETDYYWFDHIVVRGY
jgi:hypothetical protein